MREAERERVYKSDNNNWVTYGRGITICFCRCRRRCYFGILLLLL